MPSDSNWSLYASYAEAPAGVTGYRKTLIDDFYYIGPNTVNLELIGQLYLFCHTVDMNLVLASGDLACRLSYSGRPASARTIGGGPHIPIASA